MQVTFLGTGAGAPSRTRNVSAIGLQFSQQSAVWLFDCGEGTQQQFMRSPLRISQLERVFITHLHGDHVFGLPGLLATRSLQQGAATPVTVYGPPGIDEYLQTCIRVSGTQFGFPLSVVTVQPGQIYENESVRVVCARLEHRLTDFGYAVIEKPTPGRFNAEEAARVGVPAGPLYGRLKRGETITLEDGREIEGARLVGKPRPGRKLVYATDTVFCQAAIELAKDATVLIHEATFAGDDTELAEKSSHSTTLQAAQVAREAGVQTLILTHFSARYEAEDGPGVEGLLEQAQTVFPNTLAASDFWSYTVPRPVYD